MMCDLGRKITDLLYKKNNASQMELAAFVGVSPQAVSQWISGKTKPKGRYLQKIAEFLNVTVDYLLTEDKELKQNQLTITTLKGEDEDMKTSREKLDLIDAIIKMEKEDFAAMRALFRFVSHKRSGNGE